MHRGLRCLICACAVGWTGSAPLAVDLHRLWEDRCADCHGEAGDFARRFLSVQGDALQGAHPDRELRRFLQNHYLKNNEIDGVYTMLLAQAGSDPRFKERCTPCHAKAAQLARESLIRRDGVLYTRGTRRPLDDFMQQHAALPAGEAAFFAGLLERVEREVHRP